MIQIILASSNEGKLKEFKNIFKSIKNVKISSLKDIEYKKEIIENGNTFEENSEIKARQVCTDTGFITIAEDSGLCIDALGGEPGIYSARYCTKNATREQILNKVLNKLKNIPYKNRTARFVAVITAIFPNGDKIQTSGTCEGNISNQITNLEGGMTYDPIFIPKGYNKPFSNFNLEDKEKLSHRGKASKKFIRLLKQYFKTIEI